MNLPYYSANEAADRLGLEYHTFLARVRQGVYEFHRIGRTYVFDKTHIEQLARTTNEGAQKCS